MILTTRGWTALVSAAALYTGGRVLGTLELSMLAVALVMPVILGAVRVLSSRPDIRVRRELHPRRLHAGSVGHAEVRIENRGDRRTPVLAVGDRFTRRQEAKFSVAPLDPAASARGAWRVPTSRRGLYTIGPLRVAVTDALGLIQRVVWHQAQERVTVFPRVDAVRSLPVSVGRDLVGGAVHEFPRSRPGNEFHSLREYEVGDDLRRVHWRSTARTGRLMIRENDVPWQTRATLLVDDRLSAHTDESFESAVEAAASVATALHQGRSIMRLMTGGGGETPWGTGHAHYDAVMERLASLATTSEDHFDALGARLHRQAAVGSLIVLTARTGHDDLRKLATLSRRFGFVAVVRFHGAGDAAPPFAAHFALIDVPFGTRFADVWNAALLTRFGGGRTRRQAVSR